MTEASSDEEEQYEALEALRTPDPRTLRFTPMGLALGHTMQPEASARFLHSLVAVPVSRKVDTKVARTLKRVRTVFLHGLFVTSCSQLHKTWRSSGSKGCCDDGLWSRTTAHCRSSRTGHARR